MTVFTLTAQVHGEPHRVSAEWRGRALAVISEQGLSAARNVSEGTKIAARVLGPLLEQAGRSGAPVGLAC